MSRSDSVAIHQTAIIEDGAVLHEGVTVGAYSVIGKDVEIGAHSVIHSHVVLSGHTKLGAKNQVFPFACIGSAPQDLKYAGEASQLLIGDSNIIREYTTLQPGTSGGGMITSIGNGNLFMASTHVGHDCKVGNSNIMANSAALSGHVEVGNNVIIGGLCGIHQFVRLGSYSFLGGGAMVVQDIPPYCLAQGDRAYLFGLNVVGLKRQGFTTEHIRDLKNCYRDILVRTGRFREKIAELRQSMGDRPHVAELLDFLESSKRGVTSARQEDATSEAGAAEERS